MSSIWGHDFVKRLSTTCQAIHTLRLSLCLPHFRSPPIRELTASPGREYEFEKRTKQSPMLWKPALPLDCLQNIGEAKGVRSLFLAMRQGLSTNHFAIRRSCALALLLLWAVLPLYSREHKKKQDYGLGVITEIQAPEQEVLQAVGEVVNDGIIQGSKEYNKDQYIENATPAESSPLFPAWTGPGKAFYKVRTKVLDPRNFYESNDLGTLAVRYVVQSQDSSKTTVRINAVFVEDFRRTVHPSDGSVESAECKDIQDHIDVIESQKKEAADAEKHRQQELAKQVLERKNEEEEAATLAAAQTSAQGLEQHARDLRRKVERLVKAPGAPLKSAPFHSATNLKSLETGAEVVILITTPYWYGVETDDGQRGWVQRDHLELLP